ncbi:hypothetical protein CALCODRAFT_364531 [Calocera cornea HHB12733]|uniref:Conserved oligomeric Golgi complex subunit 1 n=1 Tax=Calocera cornea HHB12733 TaxID=1353952 RepID=A0A165J8U6_9BASI|nr:hypothetical protein CALCODRAFT_364531 [Calocera cornea HHB12733]
MSRHRRAKPTISIPPPPKLSAAQNGSATTAPATATATAAASAVSGNALGIIHARSPNMNRKMNGHGHAGAISPGLATARSPNTAGAGAEGFQFTRSWKPEEGMDPDEVFVKHTVPEVKAIRTKLKNDADAKQEELRLMVGERYRDLLQASTSIISIAESARHVRSSLTEMKHLCSVNPEEMANRDKRKGAHSRRYSVVDAQLPVLHQFSAHLKLMLDAPEHLWRLLERKKHLHAAWLYLLSRVVYRALVQHDEDEEADQTRWARLGIDVLGQFPIMQRQWDTVSQFRSQISQRATQSLREPDQTPEALSETLITILLLDTLPLSDTLSLFLSQRSRALSVQLTNDTPILETEPDAEPSTPGLGIASQPVAFRRVEIVQQVKNAASAALELISGTLGMVRDVFGAEDGQTMPLIEEMMDNIQSADDGDGSALTPISPGAPLGSISMSILSPLPRNESLKPLASKSQLTTPLMLRSFPSAQLLLRFLPSAIQSFKPYIDTSSPLNHLQPTALRQKTREWFNACITTLEEHSKRWMEVLDSIKEIWDVRKFVMDRIAKDEQFREEDRRGLRAWIERSSKARATEVWKARLESLEEAAELELERATKLIRAGAQDSQADVKPLEFFFAADLSLPSVPPISAANSTIALNSFRRYHTALQHRAKGRTPLVQSVLAVLELKAQELRADFQTLSDGGETQQLNQLLDEYMPAASSTCRRLADRLRVLVVEEGAEGEDLDEASVNVISFVGRLASIVSESSSLLPDLAFGRTSLQAFLDSQGEFDDVHRASLARWRKAAVKKALNEFGPISKEQWGHVPLPIFSDIPSQPSAALVQSLLSLKQSVVQLGIAGTQRGHEDVVNRLLLEYQSEIAEALAEVDTFDQKIAGQALFDVGFVAGLTSRTSPKKGNKLATILNRLREAVASSSSHSSDELSSTIAASVSTQRQRTQVLFAPLLGASKKPELFGLGPPTQAIDADVGNPLDVVKPSPRFGLLLVGSSVPVR